MTSEFQMPPLIELTGYFGCTPVEESVEDAYVCYEITDARGITLRFSLAALERSVQTVVSLGPHVLMTVSHEQATQLSLHGPVLRC